MLLVGHNGAGKTTLLLQVVILHLTWDRIYVAVQFACFEVCSHDRSPITDSLLIGKNRPICVSYHEMCPGYVFGSSLLGHEGRGHYSAMCHVQLEQRGAYQGTVTSMKESVGVIRQVSANFYKY